MTVKTTAVSSVVGFLPETAYGTQLVGSTLSVQANPTDATVTLQPAYDVDAAYLEGVRVVIGTTTTRETHVVTNWNNVTKVATVSPAISNTQAIGKPFIIQYIPIQGRLLKSTWEEDRSAEVAGVVGGGLFPTVPYEAGVETAYSLEVELGRDFFRYNNNYYAYSSLLAYALTSTGTIDVTGAGAITLRTNSTLKSFSVAYAIEGSGVAGVAAGDDTRLLEGCVVNRVSISMGNELSHILKMAVEISPQKAEDASLPVYTELPALPYSPYILASHGNVSLEFRHRTCSVAYAAAGAGAITVANTLGFSDADKITITNQDGTTMNNTITTVSHATGVITLGTNLAMNCDEWGTDVEHRYDATPANSTYVNYPIDSFTVTIDSGAKLTGDIRQNSKYVNRVFADAMSATGNYSVLREDYVFYQMQRGGNNAGGFKGNKATRFRLDVIVQEDSSSHIILRLALNGVILGGGSEEVSDSPTGLMDSISYESEGIPLVQIAKWT